MLALPPLIFQYRLPLSSGMGANPASIAMARRMSAASNCMIRVFWFAVFDKLTAAAQKVGEVLMLSLRLGRKVVPRRTSMQASTLSILTMHPTARARA
jgi:hypothetical protein